MRDSTTLFTIKLLFIAALIAFSVSCHVMRYNECRTEHPWWYCLSGK